MRLCDGLQGRKVTRCAATAWIAASLSTQTFSHAELPNSSFIVCAGTPADIFCNLASFQDEGEKKNQRKPRTHLDRASWEDGGEASGAPRPESVQSHLQKQSHLLAAASPASPPPLPPSPPPSLPPTFPLSHFSPYCPLAHFPQCYKLQTTQTSRPNAPLWMPSKLHFSESQEAGFIDNAGHTVRLPIGWQAEEPQRALHSPERHQRFFSFPFFVFFSFSKSAEVACFS